MRFSFHNRTFPVFNGNVTKEILAAFHSSPSSSSTDTFIDPHRTVHVLSGNAGNEYEEDRKKKRKVTFFSLIGGRLYNTQWSFPAPVWSRFRSTDYFGFTRITFTKSNVRNRKNQREARNKKNQKQEEETSSSE